MQLAAIGYGQMTRTLEIALAGSGHGVRLEGVLVRQLLPGIRPACFTNVEDLIAARPQLVVECASHEAVRAYVPAVLEAGIDVVIASTGALADVGLVADLEAAAARGKSHLRVASGAIGGLDALRAARRAPLHAVVYEGRKPPVAWRGTAAETVADLGRLTGPAVIFEGNAREAATLYPKNANVTAAVALAGVGFNDTRVRLIADPHATGNSHAIHAEGAFGAFEIRLANAPLPGNPKTSWLAALSIEQEVLRAFGRLDC